MKILHTADLHLGRQFSGIDLQEDFDTVLLQIIEALVSTRADVLLIAGDIFDRASPPAAAVRQFNRFLSRVTNETEAALVMIAGNHDSGDRIAAMSTMADESRAHVRGVPAVDDVPLILKDEHGIVAFSGLPFCYEYAARECFDDETLQTPEHVLKAQIETAKSRLPKDARWVIAAHAFVDGAKGSDTERPLARIGNVEVVRPDVFVGADYVALGHLHRPQSVGGDHIQYSGSPLAFGFDEAGATKSMNLVDIGPKGELEVKLLPFVPLRNVRVLLGRHAELLSGKPSNDFIKIVLTDQMPIIDGMKRLRVVYPNACELVYERDAPAPEAKAQSGVAKATQPLEVISNFLATVRGEPASEKEYAISAEAMNALGENTQ